VTKDHQGGSLHYFPLRSPVIVLLAVVVGLIAMLIELDVISFAYARLGIRPRVAWLLLLASLLGSRINLPLLEVQSTPESGGEDLDGTSGRWVVPAPLRSATTVVALNVGGALIPAAVSIYLIIIHGFYLPFLLGTGLVATIVHRLARPVRGVGIAVPMFVPPLLAAFTAVALSSAQAPALAYCIGTVGTLLGADILNLARIADVGAPVASIGGAGTFDGVFLTGILAVLLA
jgi:uncharacterized membrane protein